MTENEIKETKEWLQDFIRTFGCNFDDLETRGFNECVVCLKELLQYRAIGTVEEFKALKEKSVAKKPLYRQGTRYKWIDSARERGRYHNVEKYSNRDACPNCKEDVLRTPYCERCGQKLDWE